MTDTPTLILHIGHFKTGTTALQVYWQRNQDALAALGVHYAQTERTAAKHSAIAFAHLHESGARAFLYGYQHTQPALARWDALLDEARALPPGATLIASSEEFIRLGAYPNAADLLKQVAARAQGVTVRVVAYLRPPNDHLRAWYNQLIKLGHPMPGFDATVLNHLEPVHWDYELALAPWIAAFGARAVTLRTYHPALREKDALVRDFSASMGLPMPPALKGIGTDPNPRMDDRLTDYVRVLNAAGVPANQRDNLHARALAALTQRDEVLRAPEIGARFAQIDARARQGIAGLAALPGASLDQQLLLADPVTPQTDTERAWAETTTALLSEMLVLRDALRQLTQRVEALETGAE